MIKYVVQYMAPRKGKQMIKNKEAQTQSPQSEIIPDLSALFTNTAYQ
jgi:hypothetical protein